MMVRGGNPAIQFFSAWAMECGFSMRPWGSRPACGTDS